MSEHFDPRVLHPTQVPPEWDDVDRDLWERIKPDKYGLRTHEQKKIIDRIRAARWLLLRNDHRARCGRCNQIHEYITMGCIERPFNGLEEIHHFEKQQAREQGLIRGENQIIHATTVRALHVGTPEPINRKTAQRLLLRIRAKLGRGAI